MIQFDKYFSEGLKPPTSLPTNQNRYRNGIGNPYSTMYRRDYGFARAIRVGGSVQLVLQQISWKESNTDLWLVIDGGICWIYPLGPRAGSSPPGGRLTFRPGIPKLNRGVDPGDMSIVWVDHQDYYIFRSGDPYKPSFATVTGRGDNPIYS